MSVRSVRSVKSRNCLVNSVRSVRSVYRPRYNHVARHSSWQDHSLVWNYPSVSVLMYFFLRYPSAPRACPVTSILEQGVERNGRALNWTFFLSSPDINKHLLMGPFLTNKNKSTHVYFLDLWLPCFFFLPPDDNIRDWSMLKLTRHIHGRMIAINHDSRHDKKCVFMSPRHRFFVAIFVTIGGFLFCSLGMTLDLKKLFFCHDSWLSIFFAWKDPRSNCFVTIRDLFLFVT